MAHHHSRRHSLPQLRLQLPVSAVWQARPTLGESPTPRISASMVLDGSQGIMFGGYCLDAASSLNELWTLDLATDTWRHVDSSSTHGGQESRAGSVSTSSRTTGATAAASSGATTAATTTAATTTATTAAGALAPCPRWGHAAAVVAHSMVVFGGLNSSFLTDMCELHLVDKQWVPCEVAGPMPAARRGHSMVGHAGTVWLFGGVSRSGVLGDVWSCSRVGSAWHWTEHQCGCEPPEGPVGTTGTTAAAGSAAGGSDDTNGGPRLFDHTSVVYEGGMWVFGGETASKPARCSAHVWRLDLASLTWRRVAEAPPLLLAVPPGGNTPWPSSREHPQTPPRDYQVPRMRHTLSLVGDKCCLIGGCDVGGARDVVSDIALWDFAAQTWTRVKVDASQVPDASPTSDSGDRSALVTPPHTDDDDAGSREGPGPAPDSDGATESAATPTAVLDEAGRRRTPDEAGRPVFDFAKRTWQLPIHNDPGWRFDHCAVCLHDTVVVWGGRSDRGYCSPGCFSLTFETRSSSLQSSISSPASSATPTAVAGLTSITPYSSYASTASRLSTGSFSSAASFQQLGHGSDDTLAGDLYAAIRRLEASRRAMDVPEEFKDPQTHHIMADPVMAPDGCTYDRTTVASGEPVAVIAADHSREYAVMGNTPLRDAIETWARMQLTHQPSSEEEMAAAAPSEPAEDAATVSSVQSSRSVDSLDDGNVTQWTKGKLLGRGAFGSVYVALNTETGRFLAAKQVTLGQGRLADDKSLAVMRNEIAMLRRMRHRHIVAYLGSSRTDETTFTVFMEYVPGGDLASVLRVYGALAPPVVSRYGRQILLGLEYLHTSDILHRDIKGANVLLTTDGVAKLSDFGMSSASQPLTGGGSCSVVGTPFWMAPEVVRAEGAVFASDVWSFGCTVFEMLTTRPPWANLEAMAAIFHIGSTGKLPALPEEATAAGCALVRRCLAFKAADRPSAATLLAAEPFLAESQGPPA